MQVKTVSIDSISQDPANLRRHGERNLASIVASLRKFGQQHPIVVTDQGVILSGNGRYQAAKQLGWQEIAVTVSSLKGSDATAYAIADNRTAELAEWDSTALAETLRALQSEDYEIEAAGYNDDEINKLIEGLGDDLIGSGKEQSEIIENEIPEPPAEPITKPGDLWILGEHRLLCGDSTNADDVARLMNGEKADLLNTDPPYGVSVAGGTHDPRDKKNYRSGGKIENDSLTGDKLQGFLERCFAIAAEKIKEGAAFYVWYAGTETLAFLKAVENLGGMRHILIWVKPNFVFGRSDYHYRHEPVMYGWKPGAAHRWFGDRKQDSVWEAKVGLDIEKKQHPTSKPVLIAAKPILNHTLEHEIVYDPFLGSGTTLIAAEQLGRKCYGMEISPQYCDVIVKRWEQLTGMVAVRETPVGTPD